MTDRELLELAAKAAGWTWWRSKHGYWNLTAPDGTQHTACHGWTKFNPHTGEELADSTPGDALLEVGFCPLYTAPQPIEQPKQEPVAFICQGNAYMADDVDEFCQAKHTPLYTAPALRKPLGEQEVLDLLPEVQAGWTATTYGIWVARAIERAHGIKEKNT